VFGGFESHSSRSASRTSCALRPTLTRTALHERGVEAEIDTIDPKAVDYSAAVNIVKARQPAAVFYGGYYPEAGRLVKQLRDAGVKATFLSGDAGRDPGIAEGAGRAAEGVQATCACADPAHQPDPGFAGLCHCF
jgi:branched-chain amino acid transport system substrate-binding protein